MSGGHTALRITRSGGDFFILIWINDRPLTLPFDPARGVQEPGAFVTTKAGRVMMPVRFFTEAVGGQVVWHAADQKVHLQYGGKSIILTIADSTALVDGKPVALDQAPLIFLERTFVPARFLLETFGARVDWDRAGLSARIWMPEGACNSNLLCGQAR